MKFNTKVVLRKTEAHTGSVVTPLFLSSTFEQVSPGVTKAEYEYSRGGNPTRSALEKTVAAIENGTRAFAFGSGMAATETVLKLLRPGDEVVVGKQLYGGTYRLFVQLFQDFGIKFNFINLEDLNEVENAITDKTRLIWIESPSNPLLTLTDIKAISELRKGRNILIAVDNTFASPYLQTPLDLGADIVVHSATKYLVGHSDAVAGVVVTKDEALGDRVYFLQYACGAILGPHDSFLTLRGIRTLGVRMKQHCENALKVARYLEKHPAVGHVFYPGLESHPQHELAKRQMKDFGGVVSFNFKSGKKEDALEFIRNLEIFILADSLGGVESLVNHSATMTHADVPVEERLALGITDDLLRLSVGIEDADDLIADIDHALACISEPVLEKESVL